MKRTICAIALLSLSSCGGETPAPLPPENREPLAVYDRANVEEPIVAFIETALARGEEVSFVDPLDAAGAEFVKLALAMGRLDANYVDAYHGPDAWREAAAEGTPTADGLFTRVQALRDGVEALQPQTPADGVRMAQLLKLLRAMKTRLKVVDGQTVTFDEEVAGIYDVAPREYDLSEYDETLSKLDALVPGEGDLADRVQAFKAAFVIPKDKLQAVMDRAIAECRARTEKWYDLPEGEEFRLEFVGDKPWSGYNYYQGGYESLIQINADFPIHIDRAVDLGCHEGYPGHHVWNLFIEKELVGERGWIEYSVNPLFGPFGPIAEGSANYGIELAFPGLEKTAFEREALYPLAGLDPAKAELFDEVNALTAKLSMATNAVAKRYLDGELTRGEAALLMRKYYLASRAKTEQRLDFVETYRGYVINYNVGLEIAGSYVEAAGDEEAARWAAFRDLLTRPMTPSDVALALAE